MFLIQRGKASVQVSWFWHGAAPSGCPATMVPSPRRLPHSISTYPSCSKIPSQLSKGGSNVRRSWLARNDDGPIRPPFPVRGQGGNGQDRRRFGMSGPHTAQTVQDGL